MPVGVAMCPPGQLNDCQGNKVMDVWRFGRFLCCGFKDILST